MNYFLWTAEAEATVLEAVSTGSTVEDAALLIGTTGRTTYRHARRDGGFRSALDRAVQFREDTKERVPCGTATRYNAGCRCDACRATNRTRKARLVAERRGKPVPARIPHGSDTTYTYWSCRCDACSAAHSVKCADYQKRRKALAS